MNSFSRNHQLRGLLLLAILSPTAGCGGSSVSTTTGNANEQPTSENTVVSTTTPALPVPQDLRTDAPATQKPATKYSDDAFRIAAHDGNVDIVRKAIESGIDVDAPDPDRKYTALLMAAYNGHSHVVKLLLEKGANVDARDFEGKTPLMHASSGPFAETVTMLIDAGANVNATETTEGFTALMTAAALGEADVVKILLERGADPTVVDEDNDTAKDHASNAGKTAIVEMLP